MTATTKRSGGRVGPTEDIASPAVGSAGNDRNLHKRKPGSKNEPSAAEPGTPHPEADAVDRDAVSFPVVGLGASAGGLEALTDLFRRLPTQIGMAFVVIVHLDPTQPSYLSEVLARATSMPVHDIQNGLRAAPNEIYVIPPNAELGLSNGVLTLAPRETDGRGPAMPVDGFFRSLAVDRRSQAIGVVLSGMATDGTEGLRAIRAEGGIALVQDPATAKFSGMPESAIAAGVVDASLHLPELAAELIRLGRHPYVAARGLRGEPPQHDDDVLKEILALIQRAAGVNCSEHKSTTFRRRLARRMAVLRIGSPEEYVSHLRQSPEEARALLADVLVHVTTFFRDPDVFRALTKSVLPELLKAKSRSARPVRVWVPGCSTGQEVYSIAMSFLELMGDSSENTLQIFGTDISERAIETARAGVYPDSLQNDVTPARLKRFFERVEGGYRIRRSVRDACVFVRHDLARDPPFSKLDLVSCRNVLIYFNETLQRRVIATFHYCLNPAGLLLLGKSEAVTGFEHLFPAHDKANKVFRRASS